MLSAVVAVPAIKQCAKCHTVKDAGLFTKNMHHTDGLASWCKDCINDKNKQDWVLNQAARRVESCIKSKALRASGYFQRPHVALAVRLSSVRLRAKKLALEFNITVAYLRELYDAQPYCALSGRPFDLTTKRGTISIDRIDSAYGYIVGNVRLVRWHANLAKGEWSDTELIELAHDIAARYPLANSRNSSKST
jgi:hypothetical protein